MKYLEGNRIGVELQTELINTSIMTMAAYKHYLHDKKTLKTDVRGSNGNIVHVYVECADALYIIKSRDFDEAFFYCDPPYYNSNMGHYGGYTLHDFEMLLTTLSEVKGKFLLSSYPSDILTKFTKENKWHSISVEQTVSVDAKSKKPRKTKIEVMTANYQI